MSVEIPGVTVHVQIDRDETLDPTIIIAVDKAEKRFYLSVRGMNEDTLCSVLSVIHTTIKERPEGTA